MWLFPFSVRFSEGCEPSLTGIGFCNVDFMEAVAHVLPVVPRASDTLQMLLRALQEAVGLNRQPELLSTTFLLNKTPFPSTEPSLLWPP